MFARRFRENHSHGWRILPCASISARIDGVIHQFFDCLLRSSRDQSRDGDGIKVTFPPHTSCATVHDEVGLQEDGDDGRAKVVGNPLRLTNNFS